MFPNPAENNITLKLDKELKDAQIDMFDAMGKQIQSLYQKEDDFNIEIDLSYVPSGVYYIYIKTEDGIQTLKFLKQ